MTLKDAAARLMVLTALKDQIVEELEAAKKTFEESRAAEGVKSIAAVLPSGVPVATISWVPQDPKAVVTDAAAFLAWVRDNRPEHIERQFVSTVRPAFAKALLDAMTAGQSKVWNDPETGEIVEVPGVELKPRAGYLRPTWSKAGDGGKAAVAQAWRDGVLNGLVLPALEPAPEAGP